MPALPPDLNRLRVLETWYAACLHEVREAIARLETLGPAQPGTGRARPAPWAEWKVEVQRMAADGVPWRVHQGDCGMGKGRGCTRDEARRMLTDGVEACPYCNPDVALGL
ncbi:DUF6233 domain-containing protein (plasmid) [Streptomyces scopuliridis]|uniref:DUF6233 domain-containing protein n=1 Tax=Streptomyces scopuliridis TaxID=452529 RepID=UPI002DD96AAA|nr:DUF6233 domain-containing protein [Streptomyces scopuliridis]WSB39045.1 DUF6233 domain-containing protein [Streptomyces scopuliridis]